MTRTHVQPIYSGKQALIDAMNANAADELASMIIAAALEEEDCDFVERACIRLSAHPDETVRGNAILGFGHIARVFGQVSEEAYPIVRNGLTDASDYVRGQAYAAASDLKQFIGVELRPDKTHSATKLRIANRPAKQADAVPALASLLVRPSRENSVGDLRFLVEAATVYRDVSIYANRTALTSLVTDSQRDALLELLEEEHLRLLYHPEFPTVATNHDPLGNPSYDFGLIEGANFDVFSSVEKTLREHSESKVIARDVAKRAERLIKTERLDLGFLQRTRANVLDDVLMTEVALMILRHFVPTYPLSEGLYFRTRHHFGRLATESNINFSLASSLPKSEAAPSKITPAWVLAQYQAAMVDLHLVERVSRSAIATSPLYSRLLATILNRTSQPTQYRDFTFDAGLDARAALGTPGNSQMLNVIRRIRRRHLDLVGGGEATIEFLDQFRSEVQASHLPSRSLAWRVPMPSTQRRSSDQFLAA